MKCAYGHRFKVRSEARSVTQRIISEVEMGMLEQRPHARPARGRQDGARRHVPTVQASASALAWGMATTGMGSVHAPQSPSARRFGLCWANRAGCWLPLREVALKMSAY